MSRTGVEDKPAWRSVPAEVRAEVGARLGSPVVRAMRIWGGYGPTPTYRLRLADGRRAFFKGTCPTSNDFMRRALASEERNLSALRGLVGRWMPQVLGAFVLGEWHAVLLEDLGRRTAPPWTPALARRVLRAYAEFHLATLGEPMPSLKPLGDELLGAAYLWEWAEGNAFASVAALAGSASPDARRWLTRSLPTLAATAQALHGDGLPRALLHGDTRSDNLRFVDDRLVLLDWPHVVAGRPEFDVAMFAQSVTLESGLDPDVLLGWYGDVLPLEPAIVDASVAAGAGYFAWHCWKEDIPGLPRLRGFQRRQLKVTLAWAARRLGLREPSWLAAVPD
jgi:hypothetical protein